MSDKQQIIASTRCWVERVIVGLNFCPFAKVEIEGGRVRYRVVKEGGIEAGLMTLIDECHWLTDNPETATSLVIYPAGFDRFDDYLELLDLAERLLLDEGYEGIFQLASFHPDYCFADAPKDDPANFTNRSPYPMLHLLREVSIERALENVAKPELIPERNMEVARARGLAEMQALVAGCLERSAE